MVLVGDPYHDRRERLLAVLPRAAGHRHPASGTRHPASGIRHPAPGIRHPASGIR
jgi:hypothetical protein